jgi:hypothetical protein
MITKFAGQEHALYLKVCSKYMILPEPMPTSDTAAFSAASCTGGPSPSVLTVSEDREDAQLRQMAAGLGIRLTSLGP